MNFGVLVVIFVFLWILIETHPHWSGARPVPTAPPPPESAEVRKAITKLCTDSLGEFGQPITGAGIDKLRAMLGKEPAGAPPDPAISLRLIAATQWLLEEGVITRGPANQVIGRLTKSAVSSAARNPSDVPVW